MLNVLVLISGTILNRSHNFLLRMIEHAVDTYAKAKTYPGTLWGSQDMQAFTLVF